MDEICSNNYLEATKGAQKTIFASWTIIALLFALTPLKEIETITIPFFDIEVNGGYGLTLLMMMYFLLGGYLTFQIIYARKNLNKIDSSKIKEALQLNPTIVCENPFVRIIGVFSPPLLLGTALHQVYDEYGITLFVTFAYSIPYLFATVEAIKTKS